MKSLISSAPVLHIQTASTMQPTLKAQAHNVHTHVAMHGPATLRAPLVAGALAFNPFSQISLMGPLRPPLDVQ